MAGGRIGDELDGDEGVDVGDVGRVWGENVIDGEGGGSRVVEDVIWTMSVSIYHQYSFSFLHVLLLRIATIWQPDG